jgi:hypothetical protein
MGGKRSEYAKNLNCFQELLILFYGILLILLYSLMRKTKVEGILCEQTWFDRNIKRSSFREKTMI